VILQILNLSSQSQLVVEREPSYKRTHYNDIRKKLNPRITFTDVPDDDARPFNDRLRTNETR
jgi:hypothetical protein